MGSGTRDAAGRACVPRPVLSCRVLLPGLALYMWDFWDTSKAGQGGREGDKTTLVGVGCDGRGGRDHGVFCTGVPTPQRHVAEGTS
jgi:hypothetical protein